MASDTGAHESRDFSMGIDVSRLGALFAAVREFLARRGLSEQTLFTVELVLEEVVTNILKYGNLDPVTGKITVHVELARERVSLVIEDDGRQFDPVQAVEPDLGRPIEERPLGGVGLCLVRRMVQLFRYERTGVINHLEIGIDRLAQ